MLEVERDLSLTNNPPVNATALSEIKEEVKGIKLEARLDRNFMAKVPQKHIQHSKELVLRKRIAVQEKTNSLLMNTVDLQEKTNALLLNVLDLLLEQ